MYVSLSVVLFSDHVSIRADHRSMQVDGIEVAADIEVDDDGPEHTNIKRHKGMMSTRNIVLP